MINFKEIRNQKGFTLVELLVVIAIIGVLSTLLLLQLGTARAKARDAKRVADMNQVRSALELYFDDNGSYPAQNALGTPLTPYLTRTPTDPLAQNCEDSGNPVYDGAATGGTQCYGYAWNPIANPTQFHLWAQLERNARNALTADADLNSTSWAGGTSANGTLETCVSGTANDCIYDVGQSL